MKKREAAHLMHLYIVGDCKTTNCRTALVLTYLGDEVRHQLAWNIECVPWMIDCPTCGKTYDYWDSKYKFHKKSFH